MKRARWYNVILFLLGMMLLGIACGNTQAPPPSTHPATPLSATHIDLHGGDPREGERLFHGRGKLEGLYACSTCHYIHAHQRILVGPNMHGISERAGTRIPGMTAEEYLRQSIKYPDAYIVDGFPDGTMNQSYEDILTEEEIRHLIAYLMTL